MNDPFDTLALTWSMGQGEGESFILAGTTLAEPGVPAVELHFSSEAEFSEWLTETLPTAFYTCSRRKEGAEETADRAIRLAAARLGNELGEGMNPSHLSEAVLKELRKAGLDVTHRSDPPKPVIEPMVRQDDSALPSSECPRNDPHSAHRWSNPLLQRRYRCPGLDGYALAQGKLGLSKRRIVNTRRELKLGHWTDPDGSVWILEETPGEGTWRYPRYRDTFGFRWRWSGYYAETDDWVWPLMSREDGCVEEVSWRTLTVSGPLTQV